VYQAIAAEYAASLQ